MQFFLDNQVSKLGLIIDSTIKEYLYSSYTDQGAAADVSLPLLFEVTIIRNITVS